MIELVHQERQEYMRMWDDIKLLVLTTAIAVISYFLKKVIKRNDECELKEEHQKDIDALKTAHEEDVRELKSEIKEVKKDIKGISDSFLKKEDFVRKMVEIDKKFDRLEDKIDANAKETGIKLDKILERI